MKLADFCRVDAGALRRQLRQQARPSRQAASAPARPPRPVESHPAEVEALVLLVQDRDAMLPWLADELFVDDRHLAVFWALSAEPDVNGARELLQGTDPGAAEVLARVAVQDSEAQPGDVAARLLELAAGRRLAELQAAARVAADPLALAPPTARLRLAVESLRDPDRLGRAAADVLAALREDTP
jgi:hypothetical protein